MAGSKILRGSLVFNLKNGHAQFNRKSVIFGVSRPLVKRYEDPGYEGKFVTDVWAIVIEGLWNPERCFVKYILINFCGTFLLFRGVGVVKMLVTHPGLPVFLGSCLCIPRSGMRKINLVLWHKTIGTLDVK